MGLIHTVGLVLHPQRQCRDAIETITSWARSRDIDVLGLPAEVSPYQRRVTELDSARLAERADLLVSLGGDGTMLRALGIGYAKRIPVLGVNLGRLGFLPEIDIPDLGDALSAIDDRRFTVETRSGLHISGEHGSAIAFNDIVLIRRPGHGLIDVQVHVEGHPFVRYSADALVAATPTGSTAYSFSAGGPIVSPRVEGILVTPVAPHSAFNRALFLSQGEKLALKVLPTSSEFAVEVDGRFHGDRPPGTLVDISVQPAAARVVRLGRTTFYQRTQRKLRLTGSSDTV